MEVALTKMSKNGQVVIPSEIRKEAGIKPSTKFLVFNEEDAIILKKIDKKNLKETILQKDSLTRQISSIVSNLQKSRRH